jgi:pimeloyl-ACP methyl ester carboxylesterase
MPYRKTEDPAARRDRGPRPAVRPLLIANGFSPLPMPSGHLITTYRSAGFHPVVVPFRYEDMMDVKRYARNIALTLRGMHDSNDRQVDVVGISMGGVAALFAVKYMASARFVRTVVMAGSPMNGTPAAFLGQWTLLFQKTGRQLAFDSDFLKKLHEDPLPHGPRYMTVSGLFDLICPPCSSVLNGADNRFLPFQHHDLMFTTWVHAEIAKMILE